MQAAMTSAQVGEGGIAARRWQSRAGALLTYSAVLAYASLSPFFGWSWPQSVTLFVWPKYWTSFDIIANVCAYMPFGMLLLSMLRDRLASQSPWLRVFLAMIVGTLFSVAMELLQACLPTRVASPLDVLTNAAGAAIGGALITLPVSRGWLQQLRAWRHRSFAYLPETDWGLFILAMWLFAQLNPAIPFFEAGSITKLVGAEVVRSDGAQTYELALFVPQVIGIALNVCGFALFVSLLLHVRKRVTPNVVLVVIGGLLLKIIMAAVLLKAPQLVTTLTPATLAGVLTGLIAVPVLARLQYRWRAFAATLLVFAGGVMSKLTGVYPAIDETMKLFNWPHGHLATFANLTIWVSEIWPLVAFLFLATVFVKREWIMDVPTDYSSQESGSR